MIRIKLSLIVAVLLISILISNAEEMIATVSFVTSENLKGKAVTSKIGSPFTVNIMVSSAKSGTYEFKVELVKEVPFNFDQVVETKVFTASVVPGVNEFSVVFNKTDVKGKYFVRVYVNDGGWKRIDPWTTLLGNEERPFVILLDYYWVALRVEVNGKVYDDDGFPCPPNANVRVYGKLYSTAGGKPTPVSGVLISGKTFDDKIVSDTTDSEGFFSLSFKAPDWQRELLCGARVRLIGFHADINGNGKHDIGDEPFWSFDCIATCPTTTPTPTPIPTPTHTPTPVTTPTPTPTPSIVPIETPTQTPTTKTPGFEAAFALTGLIALAFLMRRENK